MNRKSGGVQVLEEPAAVAQGGGFHLGSNRRHAVTDAATVQACMVGNVNDNGYHLASPTGSWSWAEASWPRF